jgi:hypothetical protein
MIDQRERAESADPTEANDPIDQSEHALPIDPTEANDPTDPIESTEPFEAMERSEPSERIDHRDADIRVFSHTRRLTASATPPGTLPRWPRPQPSLFRAACS